MQGFLLLSQLRRFVLTVLLRAHVAAVLLAVGEEHGEILLEMGPLEALCDFLDALPPTLRCQGVRLGAWQALGRALANLARAVATPNAALQAAKRAVRKARGKGDVEVDAAAAGIAQASTAFHGALSRWESAAAVLRCRDWWRQSHLRLPASQRALERALREGKADLDTLAALSCVLVGLQTALEVQAVRTLRCTGAVQEPLLEPASEAPSLVLRALQSAGRPEIANILREAVEAAAAAQAAAQLADDAAVEAAAGAVSLARTERAFGGEAGGEWEVPSGWDSIPLGGANVDVGPVAPLDGRWWGGFPQVQRRKRKAAEEGAIAPPVLEESPELRPTQTTDRRVRFSLPE